MIPKKIHYCWFGGNPIPEKDKEYIKSWKKNCPDYEIIEWNESNYDISKNRYMKQAYDEKKWGFVPDYARLDIIYHEGGIYLDTDVEIIKSLDVLLKYKGFAGFEKDEYIALGLGFAAEKHSPIIKMMMEEYENIDFKKDDGSLNLTPSPTYSTIPLKKLGLVLDGTEQEIEGFHFFPKEFFCPKDYLSGKLNITDNTYCIHQYNASWQTPHQKRMKKIMNLVGRENYFKLVKLKNFLFKK